jgi:hydroxysqualene dehydroxylase
MKTGQANGMKRAVVHVVGAGVAGLAAARALNAAGLSDVVVHEAKPYAGGRRRSFYDETLGLQIDTGNFPLLSSWTSALSLVDAIGARREWREEASPGVAFADFLTGERWRLSPNAGRPPWWLLDPRRRGPRLTPKDFWSARRLMSAPPTATVASLAPKEGDAMERLWRPFCLAALNCPPEIGSARLAGAALREIVKAGGSGMRLLTPISGFGRAFTEPLVRRLEHEGAMIRFDRRLVGLDCGPERLAGLEFEHDRIDLGPHDALILAVPWAAGAALVPEMEAPAGVSAALTVHFATPSPSGAPAVTGALNGDFHWLFCYRDRISVTIKDAGARLDAPRETLAAECWRGTAALTGLSDDLPPWRVVPLRRASFLATPEEAARRPSCRTRWRNLFLAGSYVLSPLPPSIESAVRSGEAAVRVWLKEAHGTSANGVKLGGAGKAPPG